MPPVNFSIILPVHNGTRFLRQSIESVLSQSLRDFEFIIWNDHSTDGSDEIIDGYDDPRIRRYSNNVNLGLFKTLNLGIAKATGNWIRLWSQDDVMKSRCLETEAEFLAKHPEVGMCYCGVDGIDESGDVVAPLPYDCTPDVVSPSLAAQIMFYHGSMPGNIANVSLNKSVLEKVGTFLDDMSIAGDFEMWTRLSRQYSIGHINRPLIYLRSHKGQFSRQPKSYLTCMLEEQSVYETLLARQPIEQRSYAKRYDRRHRYLQYFHFMVRSLVLGDFELALQAYRVIRRIDKPIKLLGLWLITADRRFFKIPSKYTQEVAEKSKASKDFSYGEAR